MALITLKTLHSGSKLFDRANRQLTAMKLWPQNAVVRKVRFGVRPSTGSVRLMFTISIGGGWARELMRVDPSIAMDVAIAMSSPVIVVTPIAIYSIGSQPNPLTRPHAALLFFYLFVRRPGSDVLGQDLEEQYERIKSRNGQSFARKWYRSQIIRSFLPLATNAFGAHGVEGLLIRVICLASLTIIGYQIVLAHLAH